MSTAPGRAASLFHELKRRNVFRAGAAYVVGAWLIIQVVETIFPAFGFGDFAVRLVVIVLAVGFVPAVTLAWAFELTPKGLVRESEIDHDSPVIRRMTRRLDGLIMVGLALALGYFAFDKFVLDPARDAALVEETVQKARTAALVESYGEHSIAVLPFENLSNDPEQEYFSDGIAEELLNLLARVPDLRVISRSSSFAFKGEPMSVPTIAAQLGVNHVIEGSVRKFGDRVRITAQLIEARSDTHLWSQTYERRLDDVFAIQDEISAAIVGELGAALALDMGGAARVRAPTNSEAHEAYLRGRHLMVQRAPGAVEEFRRAVALDPDYALGHASLAIAIGLFQISFDLTVSEAIEQARPHAERAFELDPDLAEAHAALGWVKWKPGTLQDAEAHFREAIEINPSYSDAHMWLGHFLMMRVDYVGSFTLYQKAAQLDPLSIPAKVNLYLNLVWRGRVDEAEEVVEKLAGLHPDTYVELLSQLKANRGNWAAGALAGLDAMRSGNLELVGGMHAYFALMGLEREALADAAVLGISGDQAAGLEADSVLALEMLGRLADAVRVWERLPGGIPQEPGPGFLPSGVLIAASGDYARAGPILERAWQVFDRRAGIGLVSRDASFVLALMAVRRDSGDEAGVSELELALVDAVRRYAEAGIVQCDPWDGCVHFDAGVSAYLDGDREEGLALITQAIETGYFIPPNQAFLQFLYDDPGLAPILERQKALQFREREKFLGVVCSDNPYADVWQPAEETCQEFQNSRR